MYLYIYILYLTWYLALLPTFTLPTIPPGLQIPAVAGWTLSGARHSPVAGIKAQGWDGIGISPIGERWVSLICHGNITNNMGNIREPTLK